MKWQTVTTSLFQLGTRDWRSWVDKLVVLAFAVFTGLVVVGFTWLAEHALSVFRSLHSKGWWWPLIWTPALTTLVVYLTLRCAPGAAGSGIPQVMAALSSDTPARHRGLFVSVRLSLAKVFLTAGGLLGGLSLGREGPSVQVAAGIMHSTRRWLSKGSDIRAHDLLLAGGAAGIAAAFNTPLGGVMFAIEEMSRRLADRRSGLLLIAIIMAGLVAISIYGNNAYFGAIKVGTLEINLLWPATLIVLSCGLVGGMFSRALLFSADSTRQNWMHRVRKTHPLWFAAGCGLLVAVVGVLTQGTTFGSGYEHTKALVEGRPNFAEANSYTGLKLIVTWLSSASGVPAGIFAPSLAIGASVGHDVALLTQHPQTQALIALGMVAFLAAVTQAPMTAFIIVMEMVSGHDMVLSLMAAALVSNGIARMISPPLYSVLATFQLRRFSDLPEQTQTSWTPPETDTPEPAKHKP